MTPEIYCEATPGLPFATPQEMAGGSLREIAETVERYVRLRTGGTIRSLHVEVQDGEVILTGRTSTYYNKQLATHAALDAADELSLTNDIQVC
ncbi:MAG: BON domain-containing protein [Planctomycetia bacterium]|nr:BON domain-containing protein [Planctomycetia bacterium]